MKDTISSWVGFTSVLAIGYSCVSLNYMNIGDTIYHYYEIPLIVMVHNLRDNSSSGIDPSLIFILFVALYLITSSSINTEYGTIELYTYSGESNSSTLSLSS